jgi:Putative auto-transporter adhesin, head GIN domain
MRVINNKTLKMKMTFFMPLLSVMLFAAGFSGKENKEIVLSERFTRISLYGTMKVILVQINSDSTLLYKNGKITAKVHDGELVVKQKNSFFSDAEPFVIIPVKQLITLKIKDDAAVFTQAVLKTNELILDQRGNGMVKLCIDANKVTVYSRGTGKIQIEGNYEQTILQKDVTGCMIINYRAKAK